MSVSLLNLAVLAASALAAVAIYFDAARIGIGRRQGRRAWMNLSPGAWGMVALLLSWPGVGAYLASRSALRGSADRDAPRGTFAFLIAAMLAMAALAAGAIHAVTPPACDDETLLDQVNQRVRQRSFGPVRLPEEIEASRTSRVCRYASYDPYEAEVTVTVALAMTPVGPEIRMDSASALPPCRSAKLRSDATQLLSVVGAGVLSEGSEMWSSADSRMCRFAAENKRKGVERAWLVNVVREPGGFRLVPKAE